MKTSSHIHKPHVSADTGETRRVVLAGNPNVGKSVFFGYLTGIYAEVSNYPGTTIEIMTGRSGQDVIVDTPGIYGVSSFNDEERVAQDIILNADVILNIVDAVHLERDLFLTLQLLDMGFPMVVALNFMDEAESEGIEIDIDLISDLLGVPVIPTVATKNTGLDEIKEALNNARAGHSDPELDELITEMIRVVGTRSEAVLVLEGDEALSVKHGIAPGNLREDIYLRRRERVNDLVSHVVRESGFTKRFAIRLGQITLNPWYGLPIFAAVMYTLYLLVGVLVAKHIVGFTEVSIMQDHWEPAVRKIIFQWIPESSAAGKILAGEFGILTMTPTFLIGLLLPLVAGFYIALSFLEDSGYLARLAVLADRMMSSLGLNGRAVIPIILGFGCITMATITTRLLGTEREKTIAASILNFAIPCSAQLGVIALLLGRIGFGYAVIYILTIGMVLTVIGTVLNRWLPGESSPLLIDIPPMRVPRLDNVIRKTTNRTKLFMKEAFPWFLAGSFALALMQLTGLLDAWQKLFQPLTVHWLQLPHEAANAFVMGIVRRDFGAAGLSTMSLSPTQTLVGLITMTLFVPCIASLAILFKERGSKQAILIWLGSWVIAFLVGGLVSHAAVWGIF